jgi:FG-GAP-like repeat/HYR domain
MRLSRAAKCQVKGFGANHLYRLISFLAVVSVILVSSAFLFSGRTSSSGTNSANTARARLSEAVSIQAAGRGKPWMNMTDGRDLLTAYEGSDELRQLMARNQVQPLSLAAGDFDEDGMPDLITGYAGAGGGVITLHRGNVDSVYPNTPEARRRKADGTFSDVPFLSPARVFEATVPPSFIEAGDFNADGHQDLVIASRGDNSIYVMPGDGGGGFRSPEAIVLPGKITAMATGDVNRADGLLDLIVAVDGIQAPLLLVFEGPQGAARSNPETFELPSEASALTIGHLTAAPEADIAVAAGRDLLIVHGRDRKLFLSDETQRRVPQARTSHLSFSAAVKSMAVGYFTGELKPELAVLTEDGSLQIVRESGTADGVQSTAGDQNNWDVQTLTTNAMPTGAELVCVHVSSLSHDDLLVTDRTGHTMRVWMDDAERRERGDVTVSAASTERSAPVTLAADGEPVAVLPMRLNSDALTDLVILRSGHSSPSVMLTTAVQTFCVTNSNDCNNCGSLRDAINNANGSPGADAIDFSDSFSGVPSFHLNSALPNITESVTLDGTSTAGCGGGSGASFFEVEGSAGVGTAINLVAGSSTVRGFVLNRFSTNMIQLTQSRNNIVEGNRFGTDANGNNGRGNNGRGVFINGSPGNTIGGTVSQARNLITGNSVGVEISGSGATDNLVRSNFIGTNAAATLAIGNAQNGVNIINGASRTLIGGSIALGNLIAGNANGIAINSGTANVAQGNRVDLNRGSGVFVSSAGNTIGGTTSQSVNGVWRSGNNGVEFNGGLATDNLVQQNLIGLNLDTSGNPVDLGNTQHGVAITNASRNAIGGVSDPLGNFIAFNHGDGVSVISGNQNTILSDRIFSNTGLGIRLQPGANNNQTSPLLTSASFSSVAAESITPLAAGLTVAVSFTASANQTYNLQFFFGGNCPAQGSQFIGSIPIPLGIRMVTTNAGGSFSGSFTFDFTPPTSNGFVNATATSATGDTSQFSQCIQIGTAAACAPICPTAPAPVAATSGTGAIVSYPAATLPAGCAGVTVTCVPPSGTTFPVGTTTVTCTAADGSGPRGTCSFGVSVTAAAGPNIVNACKGDGKQLVINGSGFVDGAKVFLNDGPEKTMFVSSTQVIAFKAGKRAQTGDTLKVHNPDSSETPILTYTRVNCTP